MNPLGPLSFLVPPEPASSPPTAGELAIPGPNFSALLAVAMMTGGLTVTTTPPRMSGAQPPMTGDQQPDVSTLEPVPGDGSGSQSAAARVQPMTASAGPATTEVGPTTQSLRSAPTGEKGQLVVSQPPVGDPLPPAPGISPFTVDVEATAASRIGSTVPAPAPEVGQANSTSQPPRTSGESTLPAPGNGEAVQPRQTLPLGEPFFMQPQVAVASLGRVEPSHASAPGTQTVGPPETTELSIAAGTPMTPPAESRLVHAEWPSVRRKAAEAFRELPTKNPVMPPAVTVKGGPQPDTPPVLLSSTPASLGRVEPPQTSAPVAETPGLPATTDLPIAVKTPPPPLAESRLAHAERRFVRPDGTEVLGKVPTTDPVVTAAVAGNGGPRPDAPPASASSSNDQPSEDPPDSSVEGGTVAPTGEHESVGAQRMMVAPTLVGSIPDPKPGKAPADQRVRAPSADRLSSWRPGFRQMGTSERPKQSSEAPSAAAEPATGAVLPVQAGDAFADAQVNGRIRKLTLELATSASTPPAPTTSASAPAPGAPLTPIDTTETSVPVNPRTAAVGLTEPDPEPPVVPGPAARPVAAESATMPVVVAEPAASAVDRSTRGREPRKLIVNEPERSTGAPVSPPSSRLSAGPDTSVEAPAKESTPATDRGSETRGQPATADRVTLQLTDDDGEHLRIRVSTRGGEVRATIVHADQGAAIQLGGRIEELHQALAERGFQQSSVNVQSAGRAGETSVLAGMTGAPEARLEGSREQEAPAQDHRQGSGRREFQRPGDPEHGQQQGRPHQRARKERER